MVDPALAAAPIAVCQHCPMPTFDRRAALGAARETVYDVVVVGAGMTGAGVALDAAARGLRVALFDAGDIASGTSSKSSKMVHGGLRYLQQHDFRLVYEALRERQRLLENAPFLVRPLPFLIPLFGSNGVASSAVVRAYSSALRLYDMTGGWRIGQRHRKISRAEALAHLPTLTTDRLVAGFLYPDARGDDARVALTLARTAALDYGADVATYATATGFTHDAAGRVRAVQVRDDLGGELIEVATRCVVNATGVWADSLVAMAERVESHLITPAKGVHLSVARHRLPADVAAVLSVPGDHRNVFVVPFEDAPYTFVGTTDTAYHGDLDDPRCTPEDVAYLLGAVNASTASALTPADVTGVWAGLRPLLAPKAGRHVSARTADLSRRHRVLDAGDGVVTVTGGKWTTYRQMAEDAVDALRPYLGPLARARTAHLTLHGTGAWRPSTPLETHLYRRYGQDSAAVLALIDADPSLGELAVPGQEYVRAELVYAAREEMATSLVDLLTRRTRAHLHDARATRDAAASLAALVAPTLGWDDAETSRQVAAYHDLVTRELTSAGLDPS